MDVSFWKFIKDSELLYYGVSWMVENLKKIQTDKKLEPST